MGELRTHDEGDGFERCAICREPAVGPCARCKRPVCGDCCVLTEGGTKTFAICTPCERRGGNSVGLSRVFGWIVLPLIVLIGLAALAMFLKSR